MAKKLLFGLFALLFLGAASAASALPCNSYDWVPGEVRYDDGAGNCRRAVVDGSGNLQTSGGGGGGGVVTNAGTFAVQVTNIPHTIVDSSGLPSGAATSANQATEISSLASIVTNTSTPTGVAQNSTTSGQVGALTQYATLTSNPTYTTAKTNPGTLTTFGAIRVMSEDVNGVAPDVTTTTPTAQVGPYPSTNAAGTATAATPITCSSGNVANGTVACTLAGVSSKTTYLQGFMMTSDGATATLGVGCTITGTQSGTMNFTYTYEAATIPSFPITSPTGIAIPASATNTAIVLSCPASGAGGAHASMMAWGYQL